MPTILRLEAQGRCAIDTYKEQERRLRLDLEHLQQQMLREDDPRETAHLRRLHWEMSEKLKAYELARKSVATGACGD